MPRRTRHIDCTPFSGVVQEALHAFSEDMSYAVQMARHATTIHHKREVWAIRLELRRAESEAQALCSQVPYAYCVNQSPCGTGECAFATGDLAELDIREVGPGKRPHASDYPSYSLEAAVRPLQELRAAGV